MTLSRPVLRFAPSPNGELHLGHALSALVGYEQARAAGGRFLLRIEDIDRRPHAARVRRRHLRGPALAGARMGRAGAVPVAAHGGLPRGRCSGSKPWGLLYPCFATRSEIEAAATAGASDPDGAPLYPGLWKGRAPAEIAARKAAGEAFALRIDMAAAQQAAAEKLRGAPLTFVEIGRGWHAADRRARTPSGGAMP